MKESLAEKVGLIFREVSDPERAARMQAYMKDKFSYFGINSPGVKSLLKNYFLENEYPKPDELSEILYELWEWDEREMQYVGLRLLRRIVKKLSSDFIVTLEDLITRKSWWDTVDALSVDAGTLLLIYPELQPATTDRWIKSDLMWLRRAAIIHQLMYRDKTNWSMMQRYILETCHEPEFFIRKAGGWALRQYSKTDPVAVKAFIDQYKSKLSGLTIREGSKYL